MIADETFPIELDLENPDSGQLTCDSNQTESSTSTFSSEFLCTTCTTDAQTSYMLSSSEDFMKESVNKRESANKNYHNESEPYPETSFKSFDSTGLSSKLSLLPPRAPMKKKKSHSLQNLMQNHHKSSGDYRHVESKVKKLIDNLVEDDLKKKTLARHNSMPISTHLPQTTIDETFGDEKDTLVLAKELRKKSVKIYELEEKCEQKDAVIYDLEMEKSKMKMTFDKLRIEMYELKEKERQLKMKIFSSLPQQKHLRDSAIQTVDFFDIDSSFFQAGQRSTVRELVFSDSTMNLNRSAAANLTADLTHFSDVNNASSDNLIPDLSLCELDATRTIPEVSEEITEDVAQKKIKKKKLGRFLKLMPCVSK